MAMMREIASEPPPGGNPTMSLIDLSGQALDCACAIGEAATTLNRATDAKRVRIISEKPFNFCMVINLVYKCESMF
jgi:hypothetical protein